MKKMTTNEIRSTWLNFFKSKQHLEIPSKSLIPINDPSLLWINSGVATLKKYFSGIETPPSKRLVNSQRAIRTNDITNVGKTARHHTFFEMLGNFSIGDYFKKEAVSFAYELLTKEFKIDPTLLYITVYEDDNETISYWKEHGINQDHILKGNRDRNFWDVGQGPCGPCTEIFYDRGIKYDPNNKGIELFLKDIENDRYIEIWNIVFSQFNNDGHGNYTELARKNIDTGAGLERIASISQDVPTDFDTDIFNPIIQTISKLTSKKYDVNSYFKKDEVQFLINHDYKVIADHIKACTFAIADGAIPSNKERGSILRRLIRRAMVCARRLEIKQPFIELVVLSIIDTMKEYYPYLIERSKTIIKVLNNEEQLFNNTLENGFKLFEETTKNNKLDTETIFKLVDTYGFPFELIEELSNQKGIKIDKKAFEERFQKHQDISRSKENIAGMDSQNNNLVNYLDESTFIYYQDILEDAKVIKIFDEKFNSLESLNKKGWLVFDKTIFYATSGGQVHDEGYITYKDKKIKILDVMKAPNGQHLHLVDLNDISLSLKDTVDMHVDISLRIKSSRNHSVEHLLQHALQSSIDKSIKQEGAFKSAEKVTFDYNYHSKLTDEQIKLVENKVNEYIKQSLPVQTLLLTLDEAKKLGALAYFENVYNKIKGKLRVVCMGELSKELCGGMHVKNTNEIENFMIVKIDNKGGGSWRLEGITSNETIDKYVNEQINIVSLDVKKLNEQLSSNKINSKEYNELLEKLQSFIDSKDVRNINKTLLELRSLHGHLLFENSKLTSKNEIEQVKNNSNKNYSKSNVVCYFTVDNINPKNLNIAITELANQDNQHGFVIINILPTKLQYVLMCSKASKINFKANTIINEINKICNGAGGGSPFFAQGGTNNINLLNDIVNFLKNLN